ncbi:hypothetical protein R1flu_022561 [Riccia fluitans]|uniref:Late embryogenesis abundant protein LEA-2 subgroup domain-containing protein n=1 Tax=Riccia fluitans TaxID=41844 RepID=A0ABD1XPJ1_9MARC
MSGAKDEEKASMKEHAVPKDAQDAEAEVKVPRPFYRKRSCQIWCGVTTALLLVLVILILILSFTVFKAKNPRITVTGMTLQTFSANVDPSLSSVHLDVSLQLNVSVRNPNIASFKYENSSTFLFYRGKEVGSAAIPAGEVKAKQTVRFSTFLEIQALDIMIDANLTSDLAANIIPVSTYASIQGRLNVINVFKRHAVSTTECTANIFITNTTLRDFNCVYSLKMNWNGLPDIHGPNGKHGLRHAKDLACYHFGIPNSWQFSLLAEQLLRNSPRSISSFFFLLVQCEHPAR